MKRKFYKDSEFAQFGAGWKAFQEIAQAETEGRLMVFHLKAKWWFEIAVGNKKVEYRDTGKWDSYMIHFNELLKRGLNVIVELDYGYPSKMDIAHKIFKRVEWIGKEISEQRIGGDGTIKWGIWLGETIL